MDAQVNATNATLPANVTAPVEQQKTFILPFTFTQAGIPSLSEEAKTAIRSRYVFQPVTFARFLFNVNHSYLTNTRITIVSRRIVRKTTAANSARKHATLLNRLSTKQWTN